MPEQDTRFGGLMSSREALKYLREKWGEGFEQWSMDAFRKHRERWKIKPPLGTETAAFWTKESLDAIPKPDRTRPRPTRRKKTSNGTGNGGEIPSVILREPSPLRRPVAELAPAC